MRWAQLVDILERHQSVPAHVYLMLRFYVPRLNRHAAAVSRQHELVADRLAADISGAGVAAQALVAIEIGGHVLEQTFWPRVFDRLEHDPEPPNPFAEMGPDVWRAVGNRHELLDRLVSPATVESDTHPALRDRLAAIGQAPQWPDDPDSTAADFFFGLHKDAVTEALAADWRASRATWWKERHDDIRTRRRRLAALTAMSSPSAEEQYECGRLLEADGREDEALARYTSARQQGHAAAAVAGGRLLLDRHDDSGIALIDEGMDLDPALIEEGCSAVVDFLENRGRRADAYPYQARLDRHEARKRLGI
jgi:hypothetical protein